MGYTTAKSMPMSSSLRWWSLGNVAVARSRVFLVGATHQPGAEVHVSRRSSGLMSNQVLRLRFQYRSTISRPPTCSM